MICLMKSHTIRIRFVLKRSSGAASHKVRVMCGRSDSNSIRGIAGQGMQALAMYYETAESKEGVNAFLEKRKPRFRKIAADKAG